MKLKLLFVMICILVLCPVFVAHATPSDIVIDGDSSDWTSAGLSAVGTDPPYNTPHNYNLISSDLLEAWACKNETMFFLMMKVRGGTPDFTETDYAVFINVDPEGNTGDQFGYDCFVSQVSSGQGVLFPWNTTILTWDMPLPNSKVTGKAGGLGYIEWGVPLNEVGGNASSLKLCFYTYDTTFNELVNEIIVTLSPPVTIPEFSSMLTLALPLAAVIAVVALFKRFRRA
jgi:hypothetical protein